MKLRGTLTQDGVARLSKGVSKHDCPDQLEANEQRG